MVPATADSRGREPLAVKVPEITALFWVIKLLTTAGGEAISDFLALKGHVTAGVVETLIFVVAVWCQFRTRRYVAVAYWFLALAIAIFGTGIADAMHLVIGIPYGGTTAMWAIVLAVVFWQWHRSEGTLSIHSIITRRRETYYWATVFATFALGTALGDFTASVLHLGYFGSIVLFTVVIMIPLVAWRSYGMNSVLAFWFAYVITRPLGASIADWFGKPRSLSGLAYGEAPVAAIFLIGVAALVAYLAVTRSDVQPDTEYAPVEGYEPYPRDAMADENSYATAQYGYALAGYEPRDEGGYRGAGRDRYRGGDAPTQRYSYRPGPDESYRASGGSTVTGSGAGARRSGGDRGNRPAGYRGDDDLADYGGGWRPARSGTSGRRPDSSPQWQAGGGQLPGGSGRPLASRWPEQPPLYRGGYDREDGGRREDGGYNGDAYR